MPTSGFGIGDVCMFLGVKQHTLRYWEREIPLVSPRKSLSGRRVYTWADLDVLFRLRHLIYEKGYTLSGAKRRLWEEASSGKQNTMAHVRAIRAELLRLLAHVRKKSEIEFRQ